MPIAYSMPFTVNVIAGFLVTLLGALLALVATTWWSWAEDKALGGPPPPVVRKLNTAGFILFVAGIAWQLVGYLRLEHTAWLW